MAVAAKLLVPVGYMPAALADGGTFTLCPSGAPAAITQSRADVAPPAAHTHTATGSPHAAATSPETDAGPAGHDHDDSGARHDSWERCSLGGLASQAAMAPHWDLALQPQRPARIAAGHPRPAFARTEVPFRSRAPPAALS